MGIFSKKKKKKIMKYIDQNKNNKKMHTTSFIDYLVTYKKQKIKCIVKNYNWYEFDDIEDLKNFKNSI